MKKYKKSGIVVLLLLVFSFVLVPKVAFAATTSVYISPSSKTVTNGDSFTVQIRINSGADTYDTAAARINYDSSKLQYVSYAAGALSSLPTESGSGFFKYSGYVFSPLSGDQAMYSVTFKAIASGTASLSLSQVQVLTGGNLLTTSAGNGAVTINEPGGATSTPSTGTSKPKAKTSTPTDTTPAGDTTAPALSGDVVIDKAKDKITLSFKTNEPSKVEAKYSTKGSEAKTVSSTELKTDHTVVIGADEPLAPGANYDIALTLTDEATNASAPLAYSVRTTGVTYSVKIVDSVGKPLSNHPVTLFSDPISTTTDAQGIATFEDVTPGEHTLEFEIDKIKVRQPVLVAASVNLQNGTSPEPIVTMPFQLAQATVNSSQNWRWLLPISFIAGLIMARILNMTQLKAKSRVAVQKLVAKKKLQKNTK
jgi:hypothetical protein